MACINIVSYNSTGLAPHRLQCIKDVLEEKPVDIMFLQEHWLHENDIHFLSGISDKYLYTGNSGMTKCTDIIQGRRFGGTAILWNKCHMKTVKPVKCSSTRFSAVTLTQLNPTVNQYFSSMCTCHVITISSLRLIKILENVWMS